jgi:subtilisin-like proprotein convertase family protein
MKKITLTVLGILTYCVFIVPTVFAQTPDQKKAIADSYNQELLAELALEYSRIYNEDFEAAKAYAAANNIPVYRETENGGTAVLIKVLEDGSLLYLSTYNSEAGITVRANRLHPGAAGTLDLSLEGEGVVIGIWDDIPLSSHELFENRVQIIENGVSPGSHGTHVAGTMVGSEIPQGGAAKGMAPKATVLASFFQTNPLGEMTVQAANGLILSNHSYGIPARFVSTTFLGQYSSGARDLDQLLYNTPYYTPVFSAGNDRNTGENPTDNGYDLLTGDKVAKNNIVVAAVNGVTNYTGPNSVVMSSFSSWGPADDGRIKPDISAKGVNMFSSVANSDQSYGNASGTSMSAPSVTGTLALLQELHSDIHGTFMKSATLKALMIQTALEAGPDPGPDYRFGWGLLNAEAAAKALLDEGFASLVDELSLTNSGTFTRSVTSNGIDPLIVTIAWTDPAGTISTTNDDTTPVLVNDLDVVLEDENGNLFYPWRFTPGINTLPPYKDVNDVDNVEKVEIDAPSGNYIIRVTHKGTLLNGFQDFSMIATGISESDFTYTPDNISKQFCSNDTARYDFNYVSSSNYSGPTSLSVTGLPSGAVATFTPAVITADEDFILEISGLDAINAGTYTFTVVASGPSFTKETDMELDVLSAATLSNPVLNYPNDGETNVFIFPTLNWNGDINASEYVVELSSVSDFSSILFETTTENTSLSLPGLNGDSLYYWRVKPVSDCTEGNFSEASFTTESLTCSGLVSAQDIPIDIISASPNEIESVINIPSTENVLVGDINVTINLNHTWLADLTITLISPSGTEVVLMDGACGQADDIDVIFDDSGTAFQCGGGSGGGPTVGATVSGVMRGENLMSPFITENSAGNWTLKVTDNFSQDGGALNDFTLEICETAGLLSVADSTLEGFELFPNPAKDYFEFSLQDQNSNVELSIFAINGTTLMSKTFGNGERKIVDTSNLNQGIYFVEIISNNQRGVKKLIIK